MDKYTPSEISDITEREKKGLEALKELQLTPSAVVQKVNVGGDVFADKIIPYLADLKFKKNETNPESKESVATE